MSRGAPTLTSERRAPRSPALQSEIRDSQELVTPGAVPAGTGWTLHEFTSVDSTNLVAAGLPPWHAVRADTQTAGRGRFQRVWISDRGGLWLSAVVPAVYHSLANAAASERDSVSRSGDEAKQSPGKDSNLADLRSGCDSQSRAPGLSTRAALAWGLPLVAGLAVCEALSELGVQGIRMRWPNDVMVQDRKLAGLLLDQFVPERIVIGIGINVRNHPEVADAALQNQTIRLAECLPAVPELAELAARILLHLRRLVLQSFENGFSSLLPQINDLWRAPRHVELSLEAGVRRGVFTQVNADGCLVLKEDNGETTAYDPTQVRHLRELRAARASVCGAPGTPADPAGTTA